jgi:hypothetical protein
VKTASSDVDTKPKMEQSPTVDADANDIKAKISRQPRRRKPRERAKNDSAQDKNSKNPVIGMGDHVPAFMLRPAKITDRQRKA